MSIVEDEALILYTLQDMLEELGCQVVASALRIDDALARAHGRPQLAGKTVARRC